MLFFPCFRPTIKFQGGSALDPLFEPPANDHFDSTSHNYFYCRFGVSDSCPTCQPYFVRALGREKQHEIAKARFCTQTCSKVGQLLVNLSLTPYPMGSCRGLPFSSPLATPDSSRKPFRSSTCNKFFATTSANGAMRIAAQ